MSPMSLVPLCLLAVGGLFAGAAGQSFLTDAAPSEFPYIVRLKFNSTITKVYCTAIGLVVSSRYLLTTSTINVNDAADLEIADQAGSSQFALSNRNGSLKMNNFVTYRYFKFCNKFKGPKYPLRASSFVGNLTADKTNATLLVYNVNSTVLKKKAETVMSNKSCETAASNNYQPFLICMDVDNTTDFCTLFSNGRQSDYYHHPMLAINGQVQANLFVPQCTNFTNDRTWLFFNIGMFVNELVAGIPVVDIK